MVSFIRRGLTNLGVESIKIVKVYGRCTGEETPAWQQTFDLGSNSEISSSNQQPKDKNSLPGIALHNTSKPVALRPKTLTSSRQTSVQNLRSNPDLSKQPTPHPPIKPLSVGNVVSAGFRLYRDHFKVYLGLAFTALLWAFIPIYGWAKNYQIQAVISRQAFSELVNQPESIETVQSQFRPRLWDFWLAQLLIGLIGLGVNLGLTIVSGVIVGIPTAILIGSSNVDPGGSMIIGLIQNVVNLTTLVIYFWFYSHFFIAELPLALENQITSVTCINRSWELTKGSVMRIQLIVLVAGLISLPILSLALSPILFMLPSLINPTSIQALLTAIISLVVFGLVLLTVGNTLMMPFCQAVKAVIYYDLRSRREGLGLQLRDSHLR